MIYIHDSELKFHGKLKSSNCVVDSRWVLKLTDYGLQKFLEGAEENMEEYAFYRSKYISFSDSLIVMVDQRQSSSMQ